MTNPIAEMIVTNLKLNLKEIIKKFGKHYCVGNRVSSLTILKLKILAKTAHSLSSFIVVVNVITVGRRTNTQTHTQPTFH